VTGKISVLADRT